VFLVTLQCWVLKEVSVMYLCRVLVEECVVLATAGLSTRWTSGRVQFKCDGTRWRTGGGGEWRGNWRMEWVASTLHTTSEHGVSCIMPLMRMPRLPAVGWTDALADLNGLVRFVERRNVVSARVPSHFKRRLLRSNLRVVKRKHQDGPHSPLTYTNIEIFLHNALVSCIVYHVLPLFCLASERSGWEYDQRAERKWQAVFVR
jgi:hypothetical protein